MIWLPVSLIFLACLALALGLGALVYRQRWARQQALEARLKALEPLGQGNVLQVRWRDRSLSTIPLLNRLLGSMPKVSDLQLLILQAGNPCNLGTLVLMCGLGGTLGLLVGIWRDSFLIALAVAVLGALAPLAWLSQLRKKRLAAFDEQFSEAVEMMARALRAGHSFASALRMVGDELEDPVAGEFAKVFEDYSFGKHLDDALGDLVWRVGQQDVKFFVTAVLLQRETGGNLAEILDNIGRLIRERFRLMRQVRALSAEGRLSGLILCVLPPAMLLILLLVSPGYISPMFDHPMGRMMLISGGVSQIMGMLVIRKLVKPKV